MPAEPDHDTAGDRSGATRLRSWDRTLLGRYRPVYHPVNTSCTWCALGPCDLLSGRKGACGQTLSILAAREALVLAVTGACAHAAHARAVIDHLLERDGPELRLELGPWVQIRAPIIELVMGVRPHFSRDLPKVLDSVDSQLVALLGATHFGGEQDAIDLESKTFHAGTMDLVALEVADLAQSSAYGFPSAVRDTALVPLGLGQVDTSKPVILCIGHHSAVGHRIAELLAARGTASEVELVGLCCTAHDMARGHGASVKIVGNQRDQLSVVRAGIADVIVADQQCVRLDLKDEALQRGSCFIATSDAAYSGLPDETDVDPDSLACDLAGRTAAGTFVSDVERAAELAIAVAIRGKRVRLGPPPATEDDAAACNRCGVCDEHCPLALPIADGVFAVAQGGRWGILESLSQRCLRCGRCDSACPLELPVMALVDAADGSAPLRTTVRAGRGPISDFEIKSAGPSIVLGDIPGIVAFLACPDYPDGRDSVGWMARILAARGYIVLASGCAAMDLSWGSGGEGGPENERQSPYELFPAFFDQGGLVNTGSCVSAAHAIGAAIKVASILLHRRLAGNYVGVADYILNRVGMVGVLWGGVAPKALSISAGANRLGIPVLFGPQGERFRRTLEASSDREGWVFDARRGNRVDIAAAPTALCTTAASREEAMVEIVRLCLRPNDTATGRQVKLGHYVALSRELLGGPPGDVARWVRSPYDVPESWACEELTASLPDGWVHTPIPDPTILEGLVRSR
ncbi:MAG: acetyl-CoA decarbonylase/synthase complex subunit alpha [Actinobacteria bacterium]|nr:acetyl-CoA decarbonylase/synthase complex subunit alpha [Actinomycetota bacterium]